MTIETLAGIKILKLNIKNGYVIDVTVNMGEPVISSNIKLNIGNKIFNLYNVSMGNPHSIVFVNNEFVEVVDKNTLKVRVYERGAGETLACGTGACASLVASNENGFVNKKIDVILKGGVLKIEWNKNENNVYMTGPATTVYEGSIDFK